MNNPLTDVLPPKWRLYLYAIAFLGSLLLAAWTLADGDWLKFAGAVFASLLSATAASNTPKEN